MDFYPTTTNQNRLLTKRQNPCTQAFKMHPSNATNEPNSAINLQRNDFSSQAKQQFSTNPQHSSIPVINISSPQNNAAFTETAQINPSHRASSMEDPICVEDDEDGDDCDGPCYEKIEKKQKISTLSSNGGKQHRRLSFDEDKHSEPSTFCDTHSDMTNNCENGDFPTSPSMHHANSKNSDIKVDSIEEIPTSPELISPPCTGKASPMKKVQEVMKNVTDNLSACDFQSGASKQKLRCKLNHQYEVDLSNVSKRGCHRCQELLEECREFARGHHGSCINEEYDTTISYRCHKGHIWNLNYKNARRRWCAQCAKDERNFLKKKCEEEKVHREKQEEQTQQNLFEEAKRKAMRENQQKQPQFGGQSSQTNNNSQQRPMSTQEYFQRVDYEIETLAKKYSNEFMASKEFKNDVEYTQILQVYKILIMPEQVLQFYMFNLNADALKSEFRRMAKIIHPDKNKHPQAGQAFQKIYKVYEVAISRVEGKEQKV